MFKMRTYSSDEQYDIGKFMDFKVDVYDVINSPFLHGIIQLPVKGYYTTMGIEDIDTISHIVYETPFLAYYLQIYNSLNSETLKEGTVLKLFSIDDLNELFFQLHNAD